MQIITYSARLVSSLLEDVIMRSYLIVNNGNGRSGRWR